MKAKDITAVFRQIFDSDRLAEVVGALSGNKSRTMLTAFGIFWGVFMLILLLGGGKGLQSLFMSNFSGFASNSGFIGSEKTTKAYKGFAKGRSWSLLKSDVAGLGRISGVEIATPVMFRWGYAAKYGKRSYTLQGLKGIYPDYQKIEQPDCRIGRNINDADLRESRKVCVIGKRVYEELFPDGGNPCGKYVSVDGVYYEVVGVNFRKSDINIGGNGAESIVVPYNVLSNIYNLGDKVGAIAFMARRGVTVASLEAPVRQYMSRAHNISPDDRRAMDFFNAEPIFRMFSNLFRGINILVWLIGVGTVASGVIGVSNIMLVSIRERTVELGIRRAIGAKPRDILAQILTESEIMTLLAGFSGIVAAVAVLAVAEPMIREQAETTAAFQIPFAMAISITAAVAALGILAGVFPAMRALAIKPVDAMRDE